MGMAIDTVRRRLAAQGYCDLDEPALREIGPWLRWSPALCTTVMATGTILGSPVVLLGLAPLAALGAALNRHPFDYLYNGIVRHLTKTRPLPPHAAQRRFACGVASVWLVGTALLRRLYRRHELWLVRLTGLLFIGFAVNTLLHAWQGWQADWQAAARR